MKIQAIVFDWAGTLIDHGSCAPAGVFVEVFRRQSVEITFAQARAPMGMAKRDHITTIVRMPEVADLWRANHDGADCTEADIDAMYDAFLPLQAEAIRRHADAIDGIAGMLAACRKRGLRLGSSTGYNRTLTDICIGEAARQDISLDAVVCADDVPAGRPAPWMLFENFKRLNVYPPAAVVKVDDTVAGIDAANNAGCWAVGAVATGNELGLSKPDFDALDPADRDARIEAGRKRMLDSGAHYAINSAADILATVDEIDKRLAAGERP